MVCFAGFAGLAMSYCNGKALRQGELKTKPVHKTVTWHFGANFCPLGGRFEKYYCLRAIGGLIERAFPNTRIAVDTRKLDAIDLRILAELQSNGRITNVELSRRAKITAPPCLRRIRALEKAGYIRGYHAELDGKSLGFEVTGFVFVGLSSQKDADLKHFEESARRWPQVRECHMLSGEVDFLLKCVARDLSAFQSFITDTVTAEKNVASVKSSLVIHASKQEPGYPIDGPA
jgi:DNA-binding Lrp family transcriptional regulator